MKFIYRLCHMIRINFILARYNIDELILGKHSFFPLRLLTYLNPFYWQLKNKYTRAQRIRLALIALGPIFVKAGQIISTRRDILPPDIINELCQLQDNVPPFSGDKATKMIERALNNKISNLFAHFDKTAIASASIAQVHAATLLNGDSVVVKVLRPSIRSILNRDIDLLLTFAKIAEKYWRKAKYFKPIALVNEIAQTLYDELDLMREAANASQLKRNSADSDFLHIPKIYWDYTCTNILVMERVYGLPIHQFDKIAEHGIDKTLLAKRCIEIFFKQIFRDSFFHADLHPGNLFVSLENPHDPKIIMVDFGIVGSLSQTDQRYIAENMIAFFKRDYQRVAELHIASGWLPPNARIDQFEGAIRSVSEPILEQPFSKISYGQLLFRLFEVAARFEINIQPQLILLQKTLLNIEGLCRSLNPNINLWESGTPQIERWLKKQIGIKSFFRRLRENIPYWSEQIPDIPSLIYEVLKETKEAKKYQHFTPYHPTKSNLVSSEKFKFFIIGAFFSCIIAGTLFFVYGA